MYSAEMEVQRNDRDLKFYNLNVCLNTEIQCVSEIRKTSWSNMETQVT